jgi:hypothetical protein
MLSLLALLLLGQGTVAPVVPAKSDTVGSGTAKTIQAAPRDTTAVPAESIEVIYYGGKRVIYNADESRVYLMDSAWVRYQDLKLDGDSITYDINRHRLSSYRHSIFRTARDSVVGTELHYDVSTRKGYITMGFTQFGQGYFHGRDLWLVREKTLDVDNGAYTTCDHPKPHYQFWGKKVRVYLEDMVVVEPIVLKIGRVPVLAAPFWFFPISERRKSGFIPFKLGNSNDEGFYAKNVAWYWAINDYSDATFAVDVMSKKGFKPSFEGVYAVGPFASGHVSGTFMTEADTKHRRYTLNAQHSSKFLFGTKLDATADFQSDTSFVADYSENQVQWLKKELDSYASISRSFSNIGSIGLTARRHTDLQNHRTDINFPQLSASFVSLPLFPGWNLSSSVSAANAQTNEQYDAAPHADSFSLISRSVSPSLSLSLPRSLGFSIPLSGSYGETKRIWYNTSAAVSETTDRQANAGTGFGFSHNLFGFLNLSEGLNYSQNIHFAESTYTQAGYGAHAASSFSLFRIFGLELAGLHGLLHKATPSVNYSFTPRTRSQGFFGTPRFDTLPTTSNLGLGLANDFQVKAGEDREKLDLGNLGFTSSYDFTTSKLSPVNANLDLSFTDILFRKKGKGTHLDTTLASLDTTLGRVTPTTLPSAEDTLFDTTLKRKTLAGPQQNASLTVAGATSFNPDTRKFTGFSVNTRFSWDLALNDTMGNPSTRYKLGLAHYLSNEQDMLAAELRVQPKGWSLALTGGWNIKEMKITDYTLDITKDLHCWELVGSVSRLGSRWTYDFKIRIKAIPDVSVGKGLFGSLLP